MTIAPSLFLMQNVAFAGIALSLFIMRRRVRQGRRTPTM
jgi:hypothetical protein